MTDPHEIASLQVEARRWGAYFTPNSFQLYRADGAGSVPFIGLRVFAFLEWATKAKYVPNTLPKYIEQNTPDWRKAGLIV